MTDPRTAAALAGIRRLSGLDADRLDIIVDASTPIADAFQAGIADGRVRVRATTPAVALAGYAQLARTTGIADVSRSGVRRPHGLAGIRADRAGEAAYPLRVAYNITVGGYTTPFHGWDEWERELDLLAASGINAAHITLGQEAVWLQAFQEFGYSEPELLAWIVPPSHQAWQWLNNIQHFGQGTTRGIIERRAELARRVLARMDELEIRAILPGFSGTVPSGFADRNPGAPTVPQGLWFLDVAGPVRPDWVRSDSPEYARVGEAFYRAQREQFGHAGWWAVDLLHEGGKTGGAALPDAARGVEAAMRAADPDYRWFVQAWAGNPKAELLGALDGERLVVLDLTGEAWEKMESFGGVPWVNGILPNYGGRNALYGDLDAIARTPGVLGDERRGNLIGLTDMAEGVEGNPVVWDLFHDLVWTRGPVDLDVWFPTWIAARYGAVVPEALAAWRVLRETAYRAWRSVGAGTPPRETMLALAGQPVDAATIGDVDIPAPAGTVPLETGEDAEVALEVFDVYAATDSVISAIPSLDANQGGPMGPRVLVYEPADLVPALRHLIAAAEMLPDSPSLDYDLIDVARQCLVDAARVMLPRLRAVYDAGDVAGFDRGSSRFLALIDLLDGVLATHPDFRLDTWTERARALGDTPDEQEQLVEWAVRLVTSWGAREDFVLTEYANRDWAGLVGGYHRERWDLWFAQLRAVLRGEPTTPVDWYDVADQWVRRDFFSAPTPTRSIRDVARDALVFVEEVYAESDSDASEM